VEAMSDPQLDRIEELVRKLYRQIAALNEFVRSTAPKSLKPDKEHPKREQLKKLFRESP
jgi:hypothetical protein